MDLDSEDGLPPDQAHIEASIESFDFDLADTDSDSQKIHAGLSPSSIKPMQDYTKAKLTRLIQRYNDEYQKFFKDSLQPRETDEDLGNSQFGLVIWTAHEKEKFFEALSRIGRHNLPALADAIGSKSPVEVKAYLLRLKDAEDDRQMFSLYAKHVSHAEMGAAVEIDSDLEVSLDQAADALAAFQDFYDEAEARSKTRKYWKIDTELAYRIAKDNELHENEEIESQSVDKESTSEVVRFFHFDRLLELSRKMFMNSPKTSHHGHWTEYAEKGEEPSIMVNAAEELYNIVRSLLQKLVQTAVFLAESRLRSTSTPDYSPARLLRDIDVETALNVLNMPADSFEHWIGFSSRNQMQVVADSHEKGEKIFALSSNEVREILSVRAARGRRQSLSRLLSKTPESENQNDNHGEDFETSSEDADSPDLNGTVGQPSSDDHKSGRPLSRDGLARSESGSDSGSESEVISGTASDGDSVQPENISDDHMSRKRRRIMMEDAEDEFMEKLDNAAGIKESNYLRKLLGLPDLSEPLGEAIGPRPKKLRKLREDLNDWSDLPFQSAWEVLGLVEEADMSQNQEGLGDRESHQKTERTMRNP